MRLEEVDFGLHGFPGESLHHVLLRFRERGPIQPTRFLGLPSFVITTYAALQEAFLDEHVLPGHRAPSRATRSRDSPRSRASSSIAWLARTSSTSCATSPRASRIS
jgi:hypothetical protein